MNIITFHNPDEENGYLSNWYLSEFFIDNKKFSSMEQYMMYMKAKCFADEEIAERIMSTTDVAEIKSLGRLVKGYNENIWNGMRQVIVYEGLLAKFSQNKELRERLIATGNDIIAECAVKDTVWGIGVSMKDDRKTDITAWRGNNLLGYALMCVRKKIAML
ncbi:NADAR family protein [Pseudobutyrivibrio xylanivorans]